jgi:hypothetical protein
VTKPTFFFSHARQDTEGLSNCLRTFFEDLEMRVAQWAGVNLRDQPLGTLDRRIPHGANWDASLSKALATNRAFVAVVTPLYPQRPNCGKELCVFLQRSPKLGLNAEGALLGVENVLVIRWMAERAYTAGGQRDAQIPKILRLIEDTPADPGRDPERSAAIERYRRKGMEACVGNEPHYRELLDAFAERLRDMADLPAGIEIDFPTARNAFEYDWHQHFKCVASTASDPAASPAVEPKALESVVVFYVSDIPLPRVGSDSAFADALLAEPPPPGDSELAEVLLGVSEAAAKERFTVFHATSSLAALPQRLSALTQSGVITALLIDPATWPSAPLSFLSTEIEALVRSCDWKGPVLLPDLGGGPIDGAKLAAERDLPQRLVTLPHDAQERVDVLRRVFVGARGRLFQSGAGQGAHVERLPLLANTPAGARPQ